MMYLAAITETGFHFKWEGKGGSKCVPLPEPLPEGAYNIVGDVEALSITYTIPGIEESDDPIDLVATFDQADLDAAIAAANAPNPNLLESRIAALWSSFNNFALEQTDVNSRASISLILADPASTDQQMGRAAEWGQWWSELWTQYAQVKAQLIATGEVPEYTLANAPWTIWEIAE